MVRQRRPQLRRQRRSMDLIWPFLLIILGGLILVLIIQLVLSWFDQRATELRTQIYYYQDQGTAQLMPWGETEWNKAYDGQLVLEGDRLEMANDSRGVLSFYDGTWVRLDENTEIEVEEVVNEDGESEITIAVNSGHIWVNVGGASEDPIRFVVHTQNLQVNSYGTIFEVGMTDRESVRVVEGEVLVEIFEMDAEREVVLEQIRVGVGQQVEVTSSDLEAIFARQSVSLLEALDDTWKQTDWYSWNRLEDANPTDYSSTADGEVEVIAEDEDEDTDEDDTEDDSEDTDDEDTDDTDDSDEDDDEAEDDDTDDEDDVTAPVVKVTTPSESPYTLSESELSLSISGTTSSNTESVIVTTYDASGSGLAYELQQYTAGSTTWRYGVDPSFGNLREGRNLFTIVAVNGSGVESDPVEVILEVPAGLLDEESEDTTDDESDDTTDTTDDTTDEEEDDTSSATDEALTTPQVVSLNGDAYTSGPYTTSSDVVTIIGSVSSGTAKVFVNGYQLSKYTAGSTSWSYYAREDLGNYDIGSNLFSVIAEDASGNQTATLTFEIYREAP